MKRMIVTFENGKTLKYVGDFSELMTMRLRFKENEERRARLGMETNKVTNISYETI